MLVAVGRRDRGPLVHRAGRGLRGAGARRRALPLNLPVIDTANFIGYVLWSVWLIVFGILLLRRPRTAAAVEMPMRFSAERR